MKKYLLSAVAVAAVSISMPASAQSGVLGNLLGGVFGSSSRDGYGGSLRDGIDQIDDQIRLAFQRGEISASEAQRLEAEYFQLRDVDLRYRQDGLSRNERYELEQRLDTLRRHLQIARQNRDDGYGDQNDNYGGYGRNGCPPGLAKKNNGCLPPGQAKQRGGDYSDRYQQGGYGDQYRDGDRYRNYGDRYQDNDRFIYRPDSQGRLVEIDRRTGRVTRVIGR